MRRDTFTGLWWVPGQPERRHAGTLNTFVSEPAHLTLIGSFVDLPQLTAAIEYPVVHGFTDTGKRITLVSAQTTNTTMSAPGFLTQELVASAALVGAHFQSPESVVADATYASFTWLPEWLDQPRVAGEMVEPDGYQLTHIPPEFPEVVVAGATLQFRGGWSTTGDGIRERSIIKSTSLKISRTAPLETVLDRYVRPFENLLTLAVDAPNAVTKVAFHPAGAADDPRLVEAIYPIEEPKARRRDPMAHDMLFTYPAVSDRVTTWLPSWYAAHGRLRDVCDLYFSTRHRAGPMELQFLNLVRALEVYDRTIHVNKTMTKAAHRALVGSIVDAAPPEARDWLKEKLAFSNEPTLRMRLTRVAEPLATALEPITGDVDAFAKLVSDTRNYYTHYDPSGKEKAARGVALFRAIKRLEVFVAYLLLFASGFDASQVAELGANNENALWIGRQPRGLDDGPMAE